MKPKKVGLALGGGGARGLAHIGVIKSLEQAGIEISFIAGTSMGALVGGWYAATKDINSLENIFLDKDKIDRIAKILKKSDGGSLQVKDHIFTDFLGDALKTKNIEDCKIPFRAITTDIKNGDEVVIKKGNLLEAIRASAALPIVFHPVSFDGRLLMDGGFSNPVPADIAKKMGADFVIAVDITSKWLDVSERQFSWVWLPSLVSNVLDAAAYQLAKSHMESADVVLQPLVLNFGYFDFKQPGEIIRAGVRETKLNLKKIFGSSGYSEPTKTPFEKFIDFLFYQE
ncbi:MAG: patatin-like phospholipase family protein [bacterium]|nr:patatin-like phospholipase family protein [bacterium]